MRIQLSKRKWLSLILIPFGMTCLLQFEVSNAQEPDRPQQNQARHKPPLVVENNNDPLPELSGSADGGGVGLGDVSTIFRTDGNTEPNPATLLVTIELE